MRGTGSIIGWHIAKEKFEGAINSPLGTIPCYSDYTPLLGTVYPDRASARRAARRANDKMSPSSRRAGWVYDYGTIHESNRNLFSTLKKAHHV